MFWEQQRNRLSWQDIAVTSGGPASGGQVAEEPGTTSQDLDQVAAKWWVISLWNQRQDSPYIAANCLASRRPSSSPISVSFGPVLPPFSPHFLSIFRGLSPSAFLHFSVALQAAHSIFHATPGCCCKYKMHAILPAPVCAESTVKTF